MKLSTRTRYAVRAVFDIAFHGQGKATQARDIARRQEVPLRYLEQIFQELKRAKIVEGKRGPNGGYSLARAAEEISLGDLVRAMQGPIELLFDDSGGGRSTGGGRTAARANGTASRSAPGGRQGEVPGEVSDRSVAISVWQELAVKVSACFDGVTVRDLCRRADALGLPRGEAPAGLMYFI